MIRTFSFLMFLLAAQVNAHEYSNLLKEYKFLEVYKAASAKLAEEPKNLDAMLGKLEVTFRLSLVDQLDDALQLAERCVSAYPESSGCYTFLGMLYTDKVTFMDLKSYHYVEKSRISLLKAVELDTKNMMARYWLLMFYLNAKEFAGGGQNKAVALIADTAKIDKDAAVLLQAHLDMEDGKLRQAKSAILSIRNGEDYMLNQIKLIGLRKINSDYLYEGEFASSEKLLKEAISLTPRDFRVYQMLADTYVRQRRFVDSISQYKNALNLQDLGSLHYYTARAFKELGEIANACNSFEKALAVNIGTKRTIIEDAKKNLIALKCK